MSHAKPPDELPKITHKNLASGRLLKGGIILAACGRKRTLISVVFGVPECPLSGKADVQILTLEISLPSDRYTPVSGR